MSSVKRVEDLEVFKKAHGLTLELYKATSTLPKSETYGLMSQVRRAAVSINSNLIEGSHRNSSKEYAHFLGVSRGSCGELKYQVTLMKDLGYISELDSAHFSKELEKINMMLLALIASVRKKDDFR